MTHWPPNPYALQRTAPRVTLAAAGHPAACAPPAPCRLRPQPARRAPQSLSFVVRPSGGLDVWSLTPQKPLWYRSILLYSHS